MEGHNPVLEEDETNEVGLVALRPNKPASSGRPEAGRSQLQLNDQTDLNARFQISFPPIPNDSRIIEIVSSFGEF